MKITKREITAQEHKDIYDDFRVIEIEHGVPEANTRRLNVTVDDGGSVIGFVSGLTNRKWFNLTDLWIHKDHRNKGLGAKILKMLEDDARAIGMEHIYTWTTGYDSNDIFYKKQGYKQFTVFEDFFGIKGGHHFGFRKDLKEAK